MTMPPDRHEFYLRMIEQGMEIAEGAMRRLSHIPDEGVDFGHSSLENTIIAGSIHELAQDMERRFAIIRTENITALRIEREEARKEEQVWEQIEKERQEGEDNGNG